MKSSNTSYGVNKPKQDKDRRYCFLCESIFSHTWGNSSSGVVSHMLEAGHAWETKVGVSKIY